MYSKFGQFIDGKWQQAEKKETYDVINPATEEVIGKASKASSSDVDRALKSAEKGFAVWKKFLFDFCSSSRSVASRFKSDEDFLPKTRS